jgi:4-amino-4-deoxy-L-arabinose transferase-like glycosyltransferase
MKSVAVQPVSGAARAEVSSLLARYPTLLPVLAICGLCAAMLLPFIDKPFHMDDPMFLWTARQIQKDPLNFYGFDVDWQNYAVPMHVEMKNPPLSAYYIALVTAIFGWGERPLHIAYLLINMATAVGTFFVARRFTKHAFLAAVLAMISPVFLVTATSVMSDMPAQLFWVWSIFAWVYAVDEDKPWLLPVAGLLVAAGALTKYPNMNVIPLLGAFAVMNRKRLSWQIGSLIVPVAILIAYQLYTKHLYGHGLMTEAAGFAREHWASSPKEFLGRVMICLAFVGGCMLSGMLFLPLVLSRRALIVVVLLAIVIGVSSIFIIDPGRIYDDEQHMRILYVIQIGLMAAGGAGLLWLVIENLRHARDRDTIFLALWVGGTFCFTLFINWAINGRTILPMAAGLAIVIARALERHPVRGERRLLMTIPVLVSGAMGVAVANADVAHAVAVRNGVKEVAATLPANHGTVWFMGHWGFQWYMEKIGASPFDGKMSVCRVDDWIVMSLNNYALFQMPKNAVETADAFSMPVDSWLSTSNGETGAGFYYAGNTLLPFIVSPGTPETFILYHVVDSFAQPRDHLPSTQEPATRWARPMHELKS